MTSRRRFLTILAGAMTLPAVGAKAGTAISQWKGIALGAEAQIILDHPDADRIIPLAVSEIRRLENIFSLYRSDSQLSKLNRNGSLQAPEFEMVELLSICSNLNARTHGAFDPTVQALWSLYAERYSDGAQPDADQIASTLAVTGWNHVEFSASEVVLNRPGVMLTLNGIAQGYIADKVTEIFRRNGARNLLVNTGEISASGHAPDGKTWSVKIANHTEQPVRLSNAAIATSAPLGTTFDGNGVVGHILDPRNGKPTRNKRQISVISNSAATADGLSTAFSLMSGSEIETAKSDDTVLITV